MTYWNGHRWLAEQPAPQGSPPGRAHRLLSAGTEAALITTLVFGLIATTAFAAKPQSAVWIEGLSTTSLAPTTLSLGDPFTVGWSSSAREPWAYVRCYANASTVYRGTHADGSIWGEVFSLYDGGPSPQAFVLGESIYPLWMSGGADCVVELVTYNRNLTRSSVLASTPFSVAG